MNRYMKNSNNAIGNGDKMHPDLFSMTEDVKKTIVAGEWKLPASELNHIKQTQDDHPLMPQQTKGGRNPALKIPGDLSKSAERLKGTPLHQRLSSATTNLTGGGNNLRPSQMTSSAYPLPQKSAFF